MLKLYNAFATKARIWLFIATLAGAPFSFAPSVSLPTMGFFSFRLGLYQVVIGLFVLSMLPVIWQRRQQLLVDRLVILSLLVLVILDIISPLRSINVSRSVLLSTSVLLLIMLMLSGLVFTVDLLNTKVIKQALRAIIVVALVIGIVAILQFVFNTYSSTNTLGLCANCGASVLGFPRVNGFTAEPQFYASALLAPILLLYGLILKRASKRRLVVFGFLLLVFFLTMSRGGFAALGVGALVISLLIMYKKQLVLRNLTIGALGVLVAGLLAIGMMVTSATIRYHRQSQSISKATFVTIIDQGSGGLIKLKVPSTATVAATKTTFQSPGVITGSATAREGAVVSGIKWWHKDIVTTLFGLGVGNLGSYAHNVDPGYPLSFTIYVQYIFMLVEFGLVGLCGFLLLGALSIYRAATAYFTNKSVWLLVLVGLLSAFAVQYLFFGTYINTPYVWLYMGLGLGALRLKTKLKD